MASDAKVSEGARLERRAFREKIRRMIAKAYVKSMALHELLEWVQNRQKRYDTKPGGLGKK